MIRKPDNRTRPSRYDAARDPYLAGVRQSEENKIKKQEVSRRKFRKNWMTSSTWSLPLEKLVKAAVVIAVVSFLIQTVIGALK